MEKIIVEMINLNDYIEDKRFIKWALDPDPEIEAYFSAFMESHPEQKPSLLKARDELRLLRVRRENISLERKSEIYKQVTSRKFHEITQKRVSYLRRFIPYAAVAIVFFSLGSLLMDMLGDKQSYSVPESLLVKSAALNTMVYLADGSKKEISNSRELIDFSTPGIVVIGADTVMVNQSGKGNATNMVVVPYGKRANLKLYDKSIVELNAGSRILFPEKFANDSRSAYLSGEGFFDITKDPEHPFYVNTASTEIKVLGTSFRVEAYPDLAVQTTFLKEGKVLLRNSNHSLLGGWTEMKPNEQALTALSKKGVIITDGDPEAYSLWKKGIVKINNEPVQDVVKQVERYFNISIHLPDEKIRTRLLTGKMNLDANLEEVFVYLEKITDGKIEKVNAGEFVLK